MYHFFTFVGAMSVAGGLAGMGRGAIPGAPGFMAAAPGAAMAMPGSRYLN